MNHKKKLDKMLIMYEPLWHDIKKIASSKSSIVIAIDGHSTSGKSALAELICKLYDANVFHMDDFFRSYEQGHSSLKYANNIDFDRLETEVISPLSKKQDIEYRPFDCKIQTLLPSIRKLYKQFNVIEGAYSMHPQISSIIDIKIFLKSNYLQQVRRVIKRNGFKDLRMYMKKWIPYERKYFKHFKIEQQSHHVFKSLH